MRLISLGAVFLATGIGFGAFGAHAFKGILVGDAARWYATAVDYHLLHGVGLMAIGLGQVGGAESKWLSRGVGLMIGGTLIFSGCLYTMALSGNRGLGAVVPIGGTSLILAWCSIAWGFWAKGDGPRGI